MEDEHRDGRHPASLARARMVVGRRVRAYVGLGANVGDAAATLAAVIGALSALPGARLRGVSRLYAHEAGRSRRPAALPQRGRGPRRPGGPGPGDRRDRPARRAQGARAGLRPTASAALGPARARSRPARVRPTSALGRAAARGSLARRAGRGSTRRSAARRPAPRRVSAALRARADRRPGPRARATRLGRDDRERETADGRSRRARAQSVRSRPGTRTAGPGEPFATGPARSTAPPLPRHAGEPPSATRRTAMPARSSRLAAMAARWPDWQRTVIGRSRGSSSSRPGRSATKIRRAPGTVPSSRHSMGWRTSSSSTGSPRSWAATTSSAVVVG